MTAKQIWPVIKETFSEFSADNVMRLAAALAYYTIFSIAPMLVLATVILGMFMDEQHSQEAVRGQLQQLMGSGEAAKGVTDIMETQTQKGSGILATIVSVLFLLWGASGVFNELQQSMNTIFDVKVKDDVGWMEMIKKRFLSMGMVFVIAFLLMVSLVVSTVITSVSDKLFGGAQFIAHAIDIVVGTAVVALLFACIYKFLPDIKIAWKDLWLGAVITAVLFTLGRLGLSFYLSHGATSSAQGAAGSLLAVLLWTYWSAVIVFTGAEFTQVYANKHGSKIRPDEDAESMEGEDASDANQPSRGGDGGSAGPKPKTGKKKKSHRQPAFAAVPSMGRSDLGEKAIPLTPEQAQLLMIRRMQMQQLQEAKKAVPSLGLGTVIGGLTALVGVYLKHKMTNTHLRADHVDARLQQIENRVGSIDRLERLHHEATVRERLRDVEQRILTAAKASKKAEAMPLKERLVAMLRA